MENTEPGNASGLSKAPSPPKKIFARRSSVAADDNDTDWMHKMPKPIRHLRLAKNRGKIVYTKDKLINMARIRGTIGSEPDVLRNAAAATAATKALSSGKPNSAFNK